MLLIKSHSNGSAQDSILGPHLFLIYMNDIPNSSRHLDFILYADDTTLFNTIEFFTPNEDSDPFKTINDELQEVSYWLVANQLSLNIKKTKYIIFHTYQKNIDYLASNITLNGNVLERVDTFNFLCDILDKHLSWKAHVEMVSNKISKYCGILTKLKNYPPLYILRTSYLSMIYLHLNYGLIAWGYDCNRLQLQKRSIRTITRSKYNSHTSPLLKALEILRFPDVLLLNALTFYYKFVRNQTPAYLSTFTMTTQGCIYYHNTHHRDTIRTTRTRLNIVDKCLRNYLPRKINSIPNNLLSRIKTHSIQGFTFAVKELYTKSVPDKLHWNELLCLSASLMSNLYLLRPSGCRGTGSNPRWRRQGGVSKTLTSS